MTLSDYLAKTKETDAAFGKRAGISQSQISRLKRGICRPSWEAVAKIAEASGNKVKLSDWPAPQVEAAE